MLNISRALKSARLMKSLTGVSASEFSDLVPAFEEVLIAESLKKERERSPGGSSKHTPETSKDEAVLHPSLCQVLSDLRSCSFCFWGCSFSNLPVDTPFSSCSGKSAWEKGCAACRTA